MQEYFAAITGGFRGWTQAINILSRDLAADMSDNQIRDALYCALHSRNTTEKERAEIMRLLKL